MVIYRILSLILGEKGIYSLIPLNGEHLFSHWKLQLRTSLIKHREHLQWNCRAQFIRQLIKIWQRNLFFSRTFLDNYLKIFLSIASNCAWLPPRQITRNFCYAHEKNSKNKRSCANKKKIIYFFTSDLAINVFQFNQPRVSLYRFK